MNGGEGDIKSGWLFSSDFYQNRTPSRLDGISASEETLLRAKSILFIEELGVEMRWYVVSFLCRYTRLWRDKTRDERHEVNWICHDLTNDSFSSIKN